jgi:hypothetical protein
MSDDLSPKERGLLLTLLLHGPTMSNAQTETVRLDVSPKERDRLNGMGLIDSVKKVAYTHTLTDAGRKWCMQELATGQARTRDSALERAFYAVLSVLRSRIDIETLFGSDPQPKQDSAQGNDVEALIRSAYSALRPQPGALVSIADVRDRLATVPRADLDAALGRLITQSGVVIVPESNQSALTKRLRAAAVKLGGQLKHHIKIDRP